MKNFHAHIYFDASFLKFAQSLYSKTKSSGHFSFAMIHEHAIGPHPKAMIEAHFAETGYSAAVDWLKANREDLSILIHHDTGNDLEDHTKGTLWLGQELPLDFGFFELIKSNPHLRIHQK